MCFVLYMASDKPRREIRWEDAAPAFHVISGDPASIKAARHFSKRHVYYLGSSSYCGCDFRRAPEWLLQERGEMEQRAVAENQVRLHAYLSECLDDKDAIELFTCWSGDEEMPPQSRRSIAVDDLITPEFFFDDQMRELILVTKRRDASKPGNGVL